MSALYPTADETQPGLAAAPLPNQPQADTAVGAQSVPYMRLVGNEEIDQRAAAEDGERRRPIQIDDLSAALGRMWEAAKIAKSTVENEMLKDYRQRQGIYEADKLQEIREQGGSEIFVMLSSIKCAALEAWLKDVMMPADDKNWALKPSPISTLPPDKEQAVNAQVFSLAQQAMMMGVPGEDIIAKAAEVKKMMADKMKTELEKIADEAAENMEDVVEDNLVEGGFDDALSEALSDLVTTKAGILMGPIHRNRKAFEWAVSQDGQVKAVESMKTKMEYQRRSPFDIYPSPDACSFQDGYFFDLQRLEPKDLIAMKGIDGFNPAIIDQVLYEFQIGGLREWTGIDQQRFTIEQKEHFQAVDNSRLIDTLSFWGELPGRLLIEWGMPGIDDPMGEYPVNAWKVGHRVIGVIINKAPLGKRPYGKASFRHIPGSFWGEGLCHEIRDAQDMCNAAARAISNNSGMSSGPQVVYNDTARIPANAEVTSIYPWKVHQFLSDKGSNTHRPPIEFVTVPNITQQLMAVFELFSRIADEVSNVPSYTYGDANLSGAAKTASGLSMLISQASKGIKHVIRGIDTGLIEPVVWLTYVYEMLYNPDPSIKGDLNVEARGAVSLIAKEQQQIRRNEFLQTTANPIDSQIMGLPGRAAVLREVAKSLEMPLDEVVPDPENLEAMAQQGQMMMMLQNIAANLGVPVEQLVQAAQQQPEAAPGGPDQGRELDNAGQPVGGQDTRAF